MKISIEKLNNIALWLYFVMAFLSERTILGNLTLVFLLAVFVLNVVQKHPIKFNWYLGLEVMFIIYSTLQCALGIPPVLSAASERVQTLVLCFIFELSAYNLFTYSKRPIEATENFLNAIVVGMVVCLAINFTSFLGGERTAETLGISIAGISIGAINSSGLAWVAGIGIVLQAILLLDRKRNFWLTFLLFMVAILISGTRKGLIFVLFGLLSYAFTKSKSRYLVRKILKYSLITVAIGAVGVLFLLYIPALYNIIGYRIQNVIDYLLEGTLNEASLGTRLRLIDTAKEAFGQRPLWGWGLDNFKHVFYMGKYYTHNNYWEIAVSSGIVGFVIFFAKYVYILMLGIKTYRRSDLGGKKRMMVCLLGLCLFFILEWWQVTYFTRKSLIIYIFLLAVIQRQKKINAEVAT